MPAGSGFVERFKGKFVSNTMMANGQFVTAADQGAQSGWGTAPASTVGGDTTLTHLAGVDQIAPAAVSGGAIFRLPKPAQPGFNKIVTYSTVNGSTVFFLTASTLGTVTFAGVGSSGSTASFFGTGGNTLSNTLKSTQSCQIEMVSISTAGWLITGIAPTTTGHLTFSTST
jgi:hypothetical protein